MGMVSPCHSQERDFFQFLLAARPTSFSASAPAMKLPLPASASTQRDSPPKYLLTWKVSSVRASPSLLNIKMLSGNIGPVRASRIVIGSPIVGVCLLSDMHAASIKNVAPSNNGNPRSDRTSLGVRTISEPHRTDLVRMCGGWMPESRSGG